MPKGSGEFYIFAYTSEVILECLEYETTIAFILEIRSEELKSKQAYLLGGCLALIIYI